MNNTKNKNESRRSFLKKVTRWSMLAAVFSQGFVYIRTLFPNVLYERPRRYKIGMPEQYATGVSFLDKHSVFIFKDQNKFHAISAVCTHLGCILEKSTDGFECPCHGSCYNDHGEVLSGPAPRNLSWYRVSRSADGKVVIDPATTVSASDKYLTS